MLALLGHDKDYTPQIRACKEEIRSLKERIRNKAHNLNVEILREQATAAFASGGDDRRPPNLRCRKKLSGHFGKIYALHWSTDSADIVSASQDGKLLVWNAESTNKKVAIPLRSAWVMTCAFSPDSNLVASGGLDNLCSIFNIGDNLGWELSEPLIELQQHEGYVSCCRFVNNDQILTSSGDSTIILWDINKSRSAQHVFKDHSGDVQSVAMCPTNEKLFVSGAIDAQAKVWDLRNNVCVSSFQGHESDINDVQWFPDGDSFVSGSDDATCRLFDLKAHQQLAKYHNNEIYSTVTEVDFSKSGGYIFAGYDEEPYCLVWDTLTGDNLSILQHDSRASCLQVSPNGQALATGCWDKIVRIWA